MSQCNPSNPISSNQVVEVGLHKPRCADFQGNTLNDWLKWTAEQHCKTDWTSFDLSCLEPHLSSPLDLCDRTEKTVIGAILQALCVALEQSIPSDQDLSCCTGVIETIPTEDPWITTRTIKAIKQGSLVVLQGAVTGTTLTNPIAYLPTDKRPAVDMIFPIATDIAPSGSYDVHLRIRTTGLVQLYVTGSAPLLLVARAVYLDGVTFFTGS